MRNEHADPCKTAGYRNKLLASVAQTDFTQDYVTRPAATRAKSTVITRRHLTVLILDVFISTGLFLISFRFVSQNTVSLAERH